MPRDNPKSALLPFVYFKLHDRRLRAHLLYIEYKLFIDEIPKGLALNGVVIKCFNPI